MEGMKKCKKCTSTKVLSAFANSSCRKDGKQPYCKTCHYAMRSAWGKKHYAYLKTKGATYYQRNKERIQAQQSAREKADTSKLRYWYGWRAWDKRNGFRDTLTKEQYKYIISRPCLYCGTNDRIGLDRIDNSLGHSSGNVLPACDWCNTARSDHFTVEEMQIIGKAIADVRKRREREEQLAVLYR